MSWYWHLALFFFWVVTYVLFFSFPVYILGVLARIGIPVFWFAVPGYFALQAFLFSRHCKQSLGKSLWHFLIAFIHFPQYQWRVRLCLPLDSRERSQILDAARARTKVKHPGSVLCPFCRVEVPDALQPVPNKGIGVKRRPLPCPRCELRFDCCRYCVYFERSTGNLPLSTEEGGKCTVIKERQSVESLCPPSVAQRMKDMGWDSLYAGKKINDPFLPPDRCRRFLFREESARRDGIPEMGRTRYLLLLLDKDTEKNTGSQNT